MALLRKLGCYLLRGVRNQISVNSESRCVLRGLYLPLYLLHPHITGYIDSVYCKLHLYVKILAISKMRAVVLSLQFEIAFRSLKRLGASNDYFSFVF